VTAFNLKLLIKTTGTTATSGPGTDAITYDLNSLTSFAATFGTSDTLATLSLGTSAGNNLNFPFDHVDGGEFEVTSLGAGGASTDDSSAGGALTQGSIDLTPLGPVLSELVVACFAEGTRIRTPGGDRRVETLRAGDTVLAAAGASRRVVWVGHRHVACAHHPRPHEVQPVRIFPNAFGPGAPHADLLLSPDHAVLVHDVLIPVRYLVNGATIRREDHEDITYWHVELEAHDALLAENLPCESYLDTGNRGAFVENYWIRPARATGLGSAVSR
jgi:hypothetical protein